jgi:hypothetical protein
MKNLPSVPLVFRKMEYLSYIISHEGFKVDPNKIKSMVEWPIPKTLKNIRRLLGLMSYYPFSILLLELLFDHCP